MTDGAAIRFVIFAAPRTGSNLLCSLLNAHPAVLCHHGLFNPGGIHWARGWREGETFPAAWASGIAIQAHFLTQSGLRARGACRRIQDEPDENEDALGILLHDRGVRKILLRRRNRVRTYVSEEIARLTGVWESFDTPAQGQGAMPVVRVEPDELVLHGALNAAYYARIEDVLRATEQSWLDTQYEALTDPDEVAGILALLGIEAQAPLPAASHKRGPADLGAVVENFDELAIALRGTALLDDLYRRDVPELRCHEFTP